VNADATATSVLRIDRTVVPIVPPGLVRARTVRGASALSHDAAFRGAGRLSNDIAATIDDFLASYLEGDARAAARLGPRVDPGGDLHLRSDP
jgi:hypothetical protein